MTIELKSRTFSLNPMSENESSVLKNDAELLAGIEPRRWNNIVKILKELVAAKSESQRRGIEARLVGPDLIPSLHAVAAAHRISRLFFRAFSDEATKDDTPDAIVGDLVTMGCLSVEKNRESLRELLSLIKKEAGWYDVERRVGATRAGLFPSLTGIGTTAELRGVYTRELEFGEEADSVAQETRLDKGKPFVPVISVALTLDSGIPDRFVFQASPECIEWLIEELRLALHKVLVIQKTVLPEEPRKGSLNE